MVTGPGQNKQGELVMRITCKSRVYASMALAVLFATGQMAYTQAANTPTGIAEFAKCSRQCMQENKQCQQELEGKCKSADSDCLESCNIAYPACMAKCPKPGAR